MPIEEAHKPEPIFQMYSIEEIADRLLMGEVYVARLKWGMAEISPAFRRKAVRIFGRTEAELFGEGI